MTISEVKNLTKFLSEEDIDNIKKEIKSKEQILKGGKLDEGERTQVLNTLFAILVIEKTLELEIEEVENIRAELEAELTESYMIYDSYLEKSKADAKKKKKRRWLLDLLGISEDIRSKKEGLGVTKSTLGAMQADLNNLKQQKSNENLRDIMDRKHPRGLDRFMDHVHDCENPRNHCPKCCDELNRDRPHIHKGQHPHEHHGDHNQKEQVVEKKVETSKKEVREGLGGTGLRTSNIESNTLSDNTIVKSR